MLQRIVYTSDGKENEAERPVDKLVGSKTARLDLLKRRVCPTARSTTHSMMQSEMKSLFHTIRLHHKKTELIFLATGMPRLTKETLRRSQSNLEVAPSAICSEDGVEDGHGAHGKFKIWLTASGGVGT